MNIGPHNHVNVPIILVCQILALWTLLAHEKHLRESIEASDHTAKSFIPKKGELLHNIHKLGSKTDPNLRPRLGKDLSCFCSAKISWIICLVQISNSFVPYLDLQRIMNYESNMRLMKLEELLGFGSVVNYLQQDNVQ